MSGRRRAALAPEAYDLVWSLGRPNSAAEAALMADAAFDPHYRETWSTAQMAAILAEDGGWIVLGHDKAGLSAFGLCRQVLDEAELLLCATRRDMRQRGIGRALIGQIIETARNRNVSRLFLEVRSSNLAARALYKATGFREAGRRPGYYRTSTGESIDALTLDRIL